MLEWAVEAYEDKKTGETVLLIALGADIVMPQHHSKVEGRRAFAASRSHAGLEVLSIVRICLCNLSFSIKVKNFCR